MATSVTVVDAGVDAVVDAGFGVSSVVDAGELSYRFSDAVVDVSSGVVTGVATAVG